MVCGLPVRCVMEPFYDIPGFHTWSVKVRSLTVGNVSRCVVEVPWLAEQCNDSDTVPPAAELPPQGRWDAGHSVSLPDRASGWESSLLASSVLSRFLFSVLSIFCVFYLYFILLLSYFISLYFVRYFLLSAVCVFAVYLTTHSVNIHSLIFYIFISFFILSSVFICLLFLPLLLRLPISVYFFSCSFIRSFSFVVSSFFLFHLPIHSLTVSFLVHLLPLPPVHCSNYCVSVPANFLQFRSTRVSIPGCKATGTWSWPLSVSSSEFEGMSGAMPVLHSMPLLHA